jgi:hypothetical protein
MIPKKPAPDDDPVWLPVFGKDHALKIKLVLARARQHLIDVRRVD